MGGTFRRPGKFERSERVCEYSVRSLDIYCSASPWSAFNVIKRTLNFILSWNVTNADISVLLFCVHASSFCEKASLTRDEFCAVPQTVLGLTCRHLDVVNAAAH